MDITTAPVLRLERYRDTGLLCFPENKLIIIIEVKEEYMIYLGEAPLELAPVYGYCQRFETHHLLYDKVKHEVISIEVNKLNLKRKKFQMVTCSKNPLRHQNMM